MGAVDKDFSLDVASAVPLPPILTNAGGIDVTIEEIDTAHGLLSSNGAQVVLFIPDHGSRVDSVLADGKDGRRVHIADCITLEQMRQKNRFQKYRAVVNVTGDFEIFGVSQANREPVDGTARLHVCINCLKHLNYHGYVTEPKTQHQIRQDFNLKDFFAENSTLFRFLPTSFIERKAGYADNWPQVSEQFRSSRDFVCGQCNLDLKQWKYLLHAHHIDGNKRHNQYANLMALCVDCHRKQPLHDFMFIKAKDMTQLQSLRHEQGIFGDASSWDDTFKLVDPPFQGVLRFYKADGAVKPEIGYEIVDKTGRVIAEVEIAWPNAKLAVVADFGSLKTLKALGWKVETLESALKKFRP
jgi:hypothetical protein